MKEPKKLQQAFVPSRYELVKNDGAYQLTISGQKIGRPSKRITLHQRDLKVQSAQIIKIYKGAEIAYETLRINHLRGTQEVRLHTSQLLLPGAYRVNLIYKTSKNFSARPDRTQLPSIDEPEAWANATLEIKS